MVTAAGGHGLRRGPSTRGGPSDPRGGCTKLLPRQYMLSESDQAPQAVVTITPSAGHLRIAVLTSPPKSAKKYLAFVIIFTTLQYIDSL